MTVSNLGMVGNCFKGSYIVDKYPSFEFPANSGTEHLFEGGLWIGAMVNGQPFVTSGAMDDPTGYSTGKSGFEFTAGVGSTLRTRSSLVDNPAFSPFAISHQDFYSDFTDSNVVVPGTSIKIQNFQSPLGVSVHFESYNWNYSFANFFSILNFKITNTGKNRLDSLYIGYWADPVVRNINISPIGGTAFYNKGGEGYSDSLTLGYEFDAGGDTSYTRSYFGLKFLGCEDKLGFHYPGVDNRTRCNFNTWQFQNASDPIYFSPSTDDAKYSKLANGLNNTAFIDWKAVQKNIRAAGNRSLMLSSGPYISLKPGESTTIAFAVMASHMVEDGHSVTADNLKQKATLFANANWAQRTYNGEDANMNGKLDAGEDRNHDGKITRYILPTPPDIPKTKIIPSDNKIIIYWAENAENSVDPISNKKDFEGYRIYKSKFAFDVQGTADVSSALETIAEFDKKGDAFFFNTGFEAIRLSKPVYFDGDTTPYLYKYEIDNIENGWQHAVAVTAFDQGDPGSDLESLETSPLATLVRAFPGKPANNSIKTTQPFVYPNPYYATADWEGNRRFEEDRKLVFANLPAHATVKIYTPSGDLVASFEHNQQYAGSDIKWFSTYGDTTQNKFSGGEHAWNLLSNDNQIIARGLYIFTVKDLDKGESFKGKFIIIK